MYLGANKFYGWAMSQKPPANGSERGEELSQFNKDFIKDYDENSNERYFFESDVKYPKNLFVLHNDLPFLREINKIKKCNKLASNIYNKENYNCMFLSCHVRVLEWIPIL